MHNYFNKSVLIIIFLFGGSGFFNIAVADLIPPDSHFVEKCARIINVHEYPELVLVGYRTGPIIANYQAFIIDNNDCLELGYKFNILNIYSLSKADLPNIDLNNLELKNPNTPQSRVWNNQEPANMSLLYDSMPVGSYYAANDLNVVKEEDEYSVVKIQNNVYGLYLSKQVLYYENANSTVKYYDHPYIAAEDVSINDHNQIISSNDPNMTNGFFSDIALTNVNLDAIRFVAESAIVEGYPDGTFRAYDPINRAEFIKMIMSAFYLNEEINQCQNDYVQHDWAYVFFTDMVKEKWYTDYVCLAKITEVASGYPDGTFRPNQSISFAEVAKILTKALKIESGFDIIWYKPYVDILSQKRAIPTSINSFSQKITRGEMAEIIYRLMNNIENKESATFNSLQ